MRPFKTFTSACLLSLAFSLNTLAQTTGGFICTAQNSDLRLRVDALTTSTAGKPMVSPSFAFLRVFNTTDPLEQVAFTLGEGHFVNYLHNENELELLLFTRMEAGPFEGETAREYRVGVKARRASPKSGYPASFRGTFLVKRSEWFVDSPEVVKDFSGEITCEIK